MFTTLLETSPRRARSQREAVTSIALHALLVTAALLTTANTGRARPESPSPQHVIFAPAPPIAQPPREASAPHQSTFANPVPGPVLVVIPPLEVPTGLPPVAPGDPSEWAQATVVTTVPGGAPAPGNARDTWTGAQVDKQALAMPGSPVPAYPEFLRSSGVEGEVVIEFVVDTLGRVESGSLREVRSTHALFARSVEQVLPRLRFVPAEAGGRRVRQWVQQPFVFAIRR